jgi:hypothetical protein
MTRDRHLADPGVGPLLVSVGLGERNSDSMMVTRRAVKRYSEIIRPRGYARPPNRRCSAARSTTATALQ